MSYTNPQIQGLLKEGSEVDMEENGNCHGHPSYLVIKDDKFNAVLHFPLTNDY